MYTSWYVSLSNALQAGWSLRWMGVFFTPSFILLPLSPKIGIVEVFKIIVVFGKVHFSHLEP